MKPSEMYLLDTNTFSDIANGRSQAARETMNQMIDSSVIAVSAITEAEILYGLARKPEAVRLSAVTNDLFSVVQVLPWDSSVARAYAALRLRMSERGKSLSANDTLIGAHAIATDAILVTRDKAFLKVDNLSVVNWATDL